MNNETYMLFDRLTEEWRETSLDELTRLNDPEIQVCIYTTSSQLLKKTEEIKVVVAPVKEEVATITPVKETFGFIHAVTSRVLVFLLGLLYIWVFMAGGIFLFVQKQTILSVFVFVLFFALPPLICSKKARAVIKKRFSK